MIEEKSRKNKESKEAGVEKDPAENYAITYFSKDLMAISAKTTQRRRKYPRQQVRNFLADPVKNYERLQEISQYLKSLSGNYFRILKYLSGILTLDYTISPNGNSKMDNIDRVNKDFRNAAVMLEGMNVKHNFRWILEKLIENGEVYLYEIEEKKKMYYKEIPNTLCIVTSSDRGVLRYSVDLNKIQQDMIEHYPQEIQTAYDKRAEYKDGLYPVSEKGFAFNALGDEPHGYPVLCMMFDDIMGLDDTKDLIEGKQQLDAIKLIHQRLPLDKDDKMIFDMQVAQVYHEATKRNLPDGVAVTTNPLELTQIPFDKALASERDSIERSERNIWNSAGISDMIFSNNKASGEALKRSIVADETMIYPYLTMFENYINSKIEKTKFSLTFLETSFFSREEKVKSYKDTLANGGSRMHFLALQGFEPIDILNTLRFEQECLDIDRFMVPKKTSHTLGKDDSDGGRPTQEDVGEEISDNTEKDRESK